MSYMGAGYSGYDVCRCPKCGSLMFNGRCEDLDCTYHWYPLEEDENVEYKDDNDDDER